MKSIFHFFFTRLGISLIFVLLAVGNLYGEKGSDTAMKQILSEQDFLNIVRAYHPVVKQAGYRVQRATAAITQAQGDFDPLLSVDFNRKRFDGTVYYSYYQPQLTIPTWYGIELYAGAEEIIGSRINSESTIGQTSYIGVSVAVLKDLLLDKRRAVLKQAKIFSRQVTAERTLILNDLFFDGITAYWNWVREFEVLEVIKSIVKANESRFRYVVIEYQQGNRPAIDTSEALVQLQTFLLMEQEARLRFQNATLELSNYLWLENETPYVLPESVTPDSLWKMKMGSLPVPVLDSVLLTVRFQHPKLQAYNFKIDWLRIEQQLKFQNILPKLDVKANLLNKGYNVFSKVNTTFLENNYKYGISFSMPLRLSEGRGAYRQAKLKLAETTLDQKIEQWQIEIKVKSYFNEVLSLRQQVLLSEKMVKNNERLLRGEETRFGIGESTLFILNTRENKALESLQKLMELKTKFYKNLAGLQWAAGALR